VQQPGVQCEVDKTIKDIPTIEPEGLHMESHLYHELIKKKLALKTNSQNIFMEQTKNTAIIDCKCLVQDMLPNVQQIVNLIWHILEPGTAELFKMHIHLISCSFKAEKHMYQQQCPNLLVSGAFLPESFDEFHGFNITNKRHHDIHDEFGISKIGKIPLGLLQFVLTNLQTNPSIIEFSWKTLFQY